MIYKGCDMDKKDFLTLYNQTVESCDSNARNYVIHAAHLNLNTVGYKEFCKIALEAGAAITELLTPPMVEKNIDTFIDTMNVWLEVGTRESLNIKEEISVFMELRKLSLSEIQRLRELAVRAAKEDKGHYRDRFLVGSIGRALAVGLSESKIADKELELWVNEVLATEISEAFESKFSPRFEGVKNIVRLGQVLGRDHNGMEYVRSVSNRVKERYIDILILLLKKGSGFWYSQNMLRVVERDSMKENISEELKARWVTACLEMGETNPKFKEEIRDLKEQLDVLSMSQGSTWWEKLKLTKESNMDMCKTKKMKAL